MIASPLTGLTIPARVGEYSLFAPLQQWLFRTRRINSESSLLEEFQWLGRRVDLATLTSTKRTAAYELKIGSFGRALEQAVYNRAAFDRSYVVCNARPLSRNVALAKAEGAGIIVVSGEHADLLLESPYCRCAPALRQRLLVALKTSETRVY